MSKLALIWIVQNYPFKQRTPTVIFRQGVPQGSQLIGVSSQTSSDDCIDFQRLDFRWIF